MMPMTLKIQCFQLKKPVPEINKSRSFCYFFTPFLAFFPFDRKVDDFIKKGVKNLGIVTINGAWGLLRELSPVFGWVTAAQAGKVQ